MRLSDAVPVRGLLRCLDMGFFIPSFEEEGYCCVGDLRSAEDEVREFVCSLQMPRDADTKLIDFVFNVGQLRDVHIDDADHAMRRCGRAFDARWLETISPLYALYMGCENMGPLLYSLVRFVKPVCCLEIGAGYTSAFLLQALDDNAAEARAWSEWEPKGPHSRDTWVAPTAPTAPVDWTLHCVDNLAHEGTTANQLLEVARQLGLEGRLQLHLDDASCWLEESIVSEPSFDFVWLDGLLDFAKPVRGDISRGIDAFLTKLWPRISPGGFILLHSTLTNKAVRSWLQGVQDAEWGPPGAVLSLLEPYKRFQNSVTILQRRPPDYSEPLFSGLP